MSPVNKTNAMRRVEERIGRELVGFLHEEYHTKRKTLYEIADELEIKRPTLTTWFKRLNIPTRSLSEAAHVRYENTTPEYRRELTRNANKKVSEIIEEGNFWLRGKYGEENNAKKPEARRKISEYKKKHNPMHIEEYAMKMRVSMEQVLRDRATIQELIFKKAIEEKGYFPKFQHAEYKAVIDFAFIDEKIGIEIDGDAHYLNRVVREKDRIRDKGLKNRGWEIIRFSNERIDTDLDNVVKEVVEKVCASRNKGALKC